MAILQAMLSGGKRMPEDFYPTPASATFAVLPHIADFPKPIWEPACGDGAISKILNTNNIKTIDHDLYDYGFGMSNQNFFKTTVAASNSIITNPPFKDAAAFIYHAQRLKITHMALLLKINYWSAAKRVKLFRLWRPSKILALTWRLDFTGAGAPHTDCMWVIWNPDSKKETEFDLLSQ